MTRRRLSPVRRILGRLQHAYRDWERLVPGFAARPWATFSERVREGSFSAHLDLRHIDPVINHAWSSAW